MTTVELLKDITQTTYDSVEGYRIAADKAESPALKQAFARRTAQRAAALDKLKNALQSRGEKPVLEASIKGKAHQLLTIADTFVDGQDATIARVEQGEEYIAEQFRDALQDENLDTETRLLIEEAYRDIREGERFAKMLEEQFS